MARLHTNTIAAGEEVVNLYQYRSIRGGVQKVFAQLGDDDLYIQHDSLTVPDQRSGDFDSGSAFHSGSADSIPASFSTVKDHMLYANGVDQHQLYCGSGSLIEKLVVYKGTELPGPVPELGEDYSDAVRDIYNTNNTAALGGLDTYAAFDCLFVMTKVPCNKLTFDMESLNDVASVMSVYYWNGAAWTAVSGLSDGTDVGGDTLKQDGTVSWTKGPADEQDKHQYGFSGFWYQFRFTVALTDPTSINSVTFDDSGPQSLQNVWDGLDQYAVEVQVLTAGEYYTYGAVAVDISSIAVGDKIYVACTDPIQGLYINPGSSPNTAATTLSVKYWNGSAFAAVTNPVDGCNGFAKPGWFTFDRQTGVHATEYNQSKYQAYWYEITIGGVDVIADVSVEISFMPYFAIEQFGSQGQCNCVWKDRGCYSFNIYGPYVYVSSTARPMVLNGSDFGILKAGDGRYNKIVAMRNFLNELMVWQEELGNEGGCVTLFEGYSPSNFGKLVLTDRIGAMNSKCVAVVDGVMTATATDERLKTIAYFLSREGVCATDGKTVAVVSDDIQNYFDPQEDVHVNIDYKDKMWLNYDSAENVLRLGLVTTDPRLTGATTSTTADKLVDSGGAFDTDGTLVGDTILNTTDDTKALITAIDSSATLSIDSDIMTSGENYSILPSRANLYPVYDLVDKTWSFDTQAQDMSCMLEVAADSDAVESRINKVQLAGGSDDGYVYRLNHGDDDYNGDILVAIDAYVDLEINAAGEYVQLEEMALRTKTQPAGNIDLTFYKNGVSQVSKSVDMQALVPSDKARNQRFYVNQQGHNITVRFGNSTAGQTFTAIDIGLKSSIWEGM
jgi:hypothetical protein